MSAVRPLEDEIAYTVRRSARARRVRVNVHAHSGVEVVLPARAAEREAAAAIVELRPWIERRLAEAREAMAAVAGRAGTLPYLDESLWLVPERGRTRAHRRGAELLVAGEDELQLAAAAGARAGARIRRLARGLPPRRARPLAALLGAAGPSPAGLARGAGVAERERRHARHLGSPHARLPLAARLGA